MNKALRKAVIAGNWKMNKTPAEAKALIDAHRPPGEGRRLRRGGLRALRATWLPPWKPPRAPTSQIGAENCHWEKAGAYTGEISAEMLSRHGREVSSSSATASAASTSARPTSPCNKRVRAALDAGLTVILCVGETLEQREQGITERAGCHADQDRPGRRLRGGAEARHHRLRARVGHRHRQDRHRRAGQRGVRTPSATCIALCVRPGRWPTASPSSTAAP